MSTAEKQAALYKRKKVHDERFAILIIALGLILLIMSLRPEDSGVIGRWVNGFLFGILGKAAFAVPYFFIFFGALIFTGRMALLTFKTWISIIMLFVAVACMFAVGPASGSAGVTVNAIKEFYQTGRLGGGVLGTLLAIGLLKAVGRIPLYLVCLAVIAIALLFIIDTPLSSGLDDWRIRRKAVKKQKEEERQDIAEYEARQRLEKEEKARQAAEAAAEAAAAQAAAKAASVQTISGEKPVSLFDKIREKEEAARLKKENIVALAASETLGKNDQKEAAKPAVDEVPAPAQKTEKPEEKPRQQAPAEEPRQEAPVPAVHQPEPAPEPVKPVKTPEPKPEIAGLTPESIGRKTAVPGENITDNQQKILDYVRDENLFAGIEKIEGFGLNAEKKTQDEKPQRSVPADHKEDVEKAKPAEAPAPEPAPVPAPMKPEEKPQPAAAAPVQTAPAEPQGYVFPPIDLLRQAPAARKDGSGDDLSSQAKLLEDTLASFGVNASVIDVVKGPAVTRFEVQPATGVKVSRITSLQDDLALNLRAKSLRIEAPIPGKAAVGIEISNDAISAVYLREIIDSKEFKNAKSKISVGLGRGISGTSVVANLKDMPHLLIAGATGSGKSVCINSIIISLLYKASPDEVKLILVDPKVVELSCYNGIPHLMVPVVTEPAKAAAALGWAVAEMNDRYNKFADRGVRDLQSYNEAVRADGEEDLLMPQIVIIIDELADLIMAAQNQVEDYISRLAAKARAAGMHLIVATQRPSVDVITGVIKANIPSRIAFAVSSQVDSRTILDMAGAEKLLGKGDMLYSPQGISKPVRVQGSFVSDQEVFDVIDFIKQNCEKVTYSESVTTAMNKAGAGPAAQSDEDDELLADAIDTVVRSETASVSSLQRSFRIGYNRAARLIDLMEERGIVGPADGSKPRKVLLSIEQYEDLVASSQGGEPVPDEIDAYTEDR
ncbi:MAG: DNA translocase FtsK 4TM domain-containing protein [Firmicutes bacterium]|nr:DNA translocase FtsK 4TM domain-containing protein [Bacillota bacterium]